MKKPKAPKMADAVRSHLFARYWQLDADHVRALGDLARAAAEHRKCAADVERAARILDEWRDHLTAQELEIPPKPKVPGTTSFTMVTTPLILTNATG